MVNSGNTGLKLEIWNVPNWRNPEEYEFANPQIENPLINDQLRWEFLRRNPDYRASWNYEEVARTNFGLINPIDPKKPAKELKNSILFTNSVMRGSHVNLSAPQTNSQDTFAEKYGEHILRLEDEGFLIIGFDPLYPTRPQIEKATEILEHFRTKIINERMQDAEESRSNGNDKIDVSDITNDILWRENIVEKPETLLRVLDAHNDKASLTEIGQIIFLLTEPDADGTSHARAVAHERLKKAKSYWLKISPHKRNVVL